GGEVARLPTDTADDPLNDRCGGGGIRTRGPGSPDASFQDWCIRPLCHPSGDGADASPGGPKRNASGRRPTFTLAETPGRGGRVAEGTRLLSEYGVHAPSRVRIPPSPLQPTIKPAAWSFRGQ